MLTLPQLPPWALMWILALAIYALAKIATLATARIPAAPVRRKLAYLLLFPGMNATSFCTQPKTPRPQTSSLQYVANCLLGATLLWAIARTIPPEHPLLQGWTGMIGLILLLHFGLLQLVSLAWQAAGYNAPLLMNDPIRSPSVTEFWNRRWNTAFRQLSHQFLFKPLARRTTSCLALLLTFLASGLIHDLIISLPARAGYGLPTAYFLLQALALLFERTPTAKRLLHNHLAHRAFTIAIIALPAPLLFHPPFVTRIILPFMTAIHALPKEIST